MSSKKIKPVKKLSVVRAYRVSDETHYKLKELAKADDRKIGSKLTELINKAYNAIKTTSEAT